jgi:nicotinate-nucleotide adenylyltransferase
MRLGVLGGTFDPIHQGHLMLAEQAREQLGCARILLIPAGCPPHKPGRVITPYALRLQMVELALQGSEGLAPSSLEADSSRPSYTADTLRRLWEGDQGLDGIFLIMGSDSLNEFSTWRQPEEIIRRATLAVYPRPEARGAGPRAAEPAGLPAGIPAEKVFLLDGPRLDLSSSEIRRRVAEGRSIRFLLPEAVREFILGHRLYREDAAGPAPREGGGHE